MWKTVRVQAIGQVHAKRLGMIVSQILDFRNAVPTLTATAPHVEKLNKNKDTTHTHPCGAAPVSSESSENGIAADEHATI